LSILLRPVLLECAPKMTTTGPSSMNRRPTKKTMALLVAVQSSSLRYFSAPWHRRVH
jgi:hypothetical protein